MRRLAIALLLVGASSARADENMSGKKEMAMSLCPSAAPGAKTEVVDTFDGVELLVTARDEPTREDIRKRARRQEEISVLPERGAMEHTGLGTGSGRYGHCPGMLEATRVSSIDTPEGARIIVRADLPADVPRLQKVTHERLAALKKSHHPLRTAR